MPAEFNYFAFEEGPGAELTEDRWKLIFSWMRTPGVLTDQPTLPVNDALFVAPNLPGLSVQVYPGEAFGKGTFWSHTVDPAALSIVYNDDPNGYDRIDLVVLRTDFPNDIMEYVVIEGIPEAIPLVPEPIQNSTIWDIPLASVYVGFEAEFIIADNITDLRTHSYQANTGSSPLVAGSGITLTYDGPNIIISCNCGGEE